MPIEILMPALSPTMTEGNLAKWIVKEGDNVNSGDVIAEIETDKATMEVEAVDEGIIGKILVAEGTKNVAVNQCIALLLEDGEDKKALDDYKIEAPAAKEEPAKQDAPKAAPAPKPAAAPKPTANPVPQAAPVVSTAPAPTGGKVKASPLAKKLAQANNISLLDIPGTGPNGRIVKEDVENYIENGTQHAGNNIVRRNADEATNYETDNIRQVIASRLLESKQTIPHFYLTVDCNLDKLLDTRKQLNDAANGRYKISVNDFVIKAVGLALRDNPDVNASWGGEYVTQYNNVDVSVAVAIDGGLITPIVKNADQKDIKSISNEMKQLAAKARAGKLQPEEFIGGGFSISNLGMYGIKQFNAIVNPPQSAILAVGAGDERPVVIDGKLTTATIMTCTISADHRVVDGAVGAEFITSFKKYIENPSLMLIS